MYPNIKLTKQLAFLGASLFVCATAAADCATGHTWGSTWVLPKPTADTMASTYVVMIAGVAAGTPASAPRPAPKEVRLCYCNGPDDSFVQIRATANGGQAAATRVYKLGCADVSGTHIQIESTNGTPVMGRYGSPPVAKAQ